MAPTPTRPPAHPVRTARARASGPLRRGGRLVAVLAAALLTGTAAPAWASPVAAPASQTSGTAVAPVVPPDADRLEHDVRSYLAKRSVTASVRVRDLRTGQEYGYRSGSHYDSASVVKVAIMAAVLRRQEQQDRYLTTTEVRLLDKMIRRSDNDAASRLYASLGRGAGMQRFYARAGMTRTTSGPGTSWGLTRITATDQVVLLGHLARPTDLLTRNGRIYARKLMASVTASQAWGVSAGPPDGTRVELKNGWLSRSSHGWRVHSVGHVKGGGRDYLVAVLTMDSSTMDRGIARVEGVSRIVWRDLAPAPAD